MIHTNHAFDIYPHPNIIQSISKAIIVVTYSKHKATTMKGLLKKLFLVVLHYSVVGSEERNYHSKLLNCCHCTVVCYFVSRVVEL